MGRAKILKMEERETTILACARLIAEQDYRLLEIVEEMGICLSTLYSYIMQDLPIINMGLYLECRERMETHKHEHRGSVKNRLDTTSVE